MGFPGDSDDKESAGPRVLFKSGQGNRGLSTCGTTHGASLKFPSEAGYILRYAGKAGEPSRQRRGIDSPVAIRRGEGAQMKWSLCYSFFCLLVSSVSGLCPDTKGTVEDTFFFLGSLVQSRCGEGGMLKTNNTGVCSQCLTGSAPAHGA